MYKKGKSEQMYKKKKKNVEFLYIFKCRCVMFEILLIGNRIE